jgi:hypothetical protein
MPDPFGRESAVSGQYVEVGMPLSQISGGGDGDHHPWSQTFAEARLHVCAEGVCGAASQIPQQVSATPEERTQ